MAKIGCIAVLGLREDRYVVEWGLTSGIILYECPETYL